MLLLIAWVFWFFCEEERNVGTEDVPVKHSLEDKDAIGEDFIKTNANQNTNNKQVVVEEDVDTSIIQFDESENPFNYDYNDFGFNDEKEDKAPEESEEEEIKLYFVNLDESENKFDVIMEEIVSPIVENFEYNYFNDNVNNEVNYAFPPIKDYPITSNNRDMLLANQVGGGASQVYHVTEYSHMSPDFPESNNNTKVKVKPTKLTVKNEAAGRIHSITVKGTHESQQNNEALGGVKGDEIKQVHVHRTSTMLCMHPDNFTHESQQNNEALGGDQGIIVDGYQSYDNTSSVDILHNEIVAENSIMPVVENTSESCNESFLESLDGNHKEDKVKVGIGKFDESKSRKSKNKSDKNDKGEEIVKLGILKIGKLDESNIKKVKNTPSAKLTDFDKIMKSRKKHTDVIDKTARIFGSLSHHREERKGDIQQKPLSKNWSKLRDAVQKKEYKTLVNNKLQPKDPSTFML